MKTKRISLFLAILFVFGLFLAACGDNSPSPASSPDDAGNGDGLTDVIKEPAEVGPIPDGAIDFADGNYGFVMINLAPADADAAKISLIDFNGGRALKVDPSEGKVPYLGIDVSSLYGGRVADIRTIEMRIWTEHASGNFYASGGTLEIFTGADNRRSDVFWGVALERNNPRVLAADLDANAVFEPGAQNIIQLKKGDDRSPDTATAVIIDYIIARDAAGNAIPADTTAGFDMPPGFGDADMTFLYDTANDVVLGFLDDGANGFSGGGWQAAGKINVHVDDVVNQTVLDLLAPGLIITVAYEAERAPVLVFQSWTDGAPNGWAQIFPFVNISNTIAQFRYEDIVEEFGEDFEAFLNRIYFNDRGTELTVTAVIFGERTHESEFQPIRMGDANFSELMPYNLETGSCAAWGQAVRLNTPGFAEVDDSGNPGDFDPEWLSTPDGYITIIYVGEAPPELILQRTTNRFDSQIWCKVVPDLAIHDEAQGIMQWSTADILAAWDEAGGGALEDELCTFWVGGTQTDVTVVSVILHHTLW